MAVLVKVYTPRTTESKQEVQITELGGSFQNPSTTGLKIAWLKPDNQLNSAITYLKGYDNAAPTVGTTQPDIVLPIPANTSGAGEGTIRVFPPLVGLAALSWAAVTAAGTGGTTSPSSAFNVNYGVDA